MKSLEIAALSNKRTDSIPNDYILHGPIRPSVTTHLHKIFENIATTTAAKNTALVFEAKEAVRTYTYKHVNSIANRLAKTILQIVAENHLSANDDGDYIVAVSMHPSDYLVIILLAILKAGAAYSPLDPTFPRARKQYILEEAKPFLVISDEDAGYFGNAFKLTLKDLLSSAEDLLFNPEVNEDPLPEGKQLRHQEDDLAIILYTSGSTGLPKGVRLTNTSILNRLRWQFQKFPYGKTETIGVFKTVLTFTDSFCEIFGPLLNGLGVLVVPKIVTQNSEELVKLLEKYKIERIMLVPSLLMSMLIYLNLQKNQKLLKHLKLWICSGEVLPYSLVKEFYKYFPDEQHQLSNYYGSTEITGDVTFHRVSRDDLNHWEKVPIGKPIDNTIAYILDKNRLPVKSGEVGELFVSGLNLSAGYVNSRHPDKFYTNPFSDDPQFSTLFKTGDFAKIENGMLWFEGRGDFQVKIRGHRVDLIEIEKVVNDIAGVVKGVAACYKPEEIDQKLLVFVVADESLSREQLRKDLKTNLVSYMVPQVVLVERIPLLINGKIDRQTLLKDYSSSRNGVGSDIDYTRVPEDQIEAAKVLFQTVANFLDKADGVTISIDANFYESGGTSLNLMFTIAKLGEAGYYTSVEDFINACNLGEILNKLSLKGIAPAASPSRPTRYQTKPLEDKYKEIFTDILYTSFYNKSSVDYWLRSELSFADYKEMADKYWEHLLQQNLSFVVESLKEGKVVGIAWNQDVRNEPEIELSSKYAVILEMVKNKEKEVCDMLAAKEGVDFYAAVSATSSELSPKENVEVIKFIEGETLELARKHKFKGVLTSNLNPLTQQLATDVYGYKTYIDYSISQYIAEDGTKPFVMAPDSQRIFVQWKELSLDN